MSNRHQQRHLRQQQHELIQAFADAGLSTIQTKDRRHLRESDATCHPDVGKSDSPRTGSDHTSLNGMIAGITTKTMNKTNTVDTKSISAEAIAAACIETIESGNENFAVTIATSTTTPSETNGTNEDTDNASSSLSKLFSKKKQPNGGDSETAACTQNEFAIETPSDSGTLKRRDSVLDMFKKRLSSLNLSEEEYGKANEKTEFDTDSDSDSDDNRDECDGVDVGLKLEKNVGGDDSIGLDVFGGDSRFAIADDGWVSFSNQAA